MQDSQSNLIDAQYQEIQRLRENVSQLQYELATVIKEKDHLKQKLEEEKRYSKFMFDEAWNQTYNVIELLENS